MKKMPTGKLVLFLFVTKTIYTECLLSPEIPQYIFNGLRCQ